MYVWSNNAVQVHGQMHVQNLLFEIVSHREKTSNVTLRISTPLLELARENSINLSRLLEYAIILVVVKEGKGLNAHNLFDNGTINLYFKKVAPGRGFEPRRDKAQWISSPPPSLARLPRRSQFEITTI